MIGGFHLPRRQMSLARELVPQGGANARTCAVEAISFCTKGHMFWIQQVVLDCEGNLQSTPKLSLIPMARRAAVKRPGPA